MGGCVSWPTPQDYDEAVQRALLNLNDPDLRNGTVESRITGTFANVYRIRSGNGTWAVRCFLRDFPDHKERYAAISAHLESASLAYIVGFQFLESGIRVKRKWYPILKMEWIEAQTFRDYIEKNISNPPAIAALADRWMVMLRALRKNNVAHGDLQHGNVLIRGGHFRLVDYDAMFVPALAGWTSHEVGHCNYQHPGRTENDFGIDLDNLSGWVIYLSLLALSIQPGLWAQFGGGEEHILFKKEDLEQPHSSRLFRGLEQLKDDRIQKYLPLFCSFLDGGLSEIASPVDVIGIKPKKRETPRPAKQAWSQEVQLDLFTVSKPTVVEPPLVEDIPAVFNPSIGSDVFHFSGSFVSERMVIAFYAAFIFVILTLMARGTISMAEAFLVLLAGLGCVVAVLTCSYMSLREVRGKLQLWFTLYCRRWIGEIVRHSLVALSRVITWLDDKEAQDGRRLAERAGEYTRREKKRIAEVKTTLAAFIDELNERRSQLREAELDETSAVLSKLQTQHSVLLQEGAFLMNAPAHRMGHPRLSRLWSWRLRVEELARKGPPIILPDQEQANIRKKYELELHTVQESERFALQGTQRKIERIQATAKRYREWIGFRRDQQHIYFARMKRALTRQIEKGNLWLDMNQREMKRCVAEMNRYCEIRLSRYLPRLFDFFPKV
jgi:hypothetical protein